MFTGRTLATLLASFAIGAALLNGCGSRGPLDDTPVPDAALDDVEAASDADVADARLEAGIIACGACLVQSCGQQIFGCIQAPACRTILQCVTTECLGGGGGSGGINAGCIFKCAGNDPSGALGVVNIFQCITGECGSDCAPVLANLGGGLGGRRDGGAPRDSGGPRPDSGGPPPDGGGLDGGGLGAGGNGNGAQGAEAFEQIFSAWPELSSAFATTEREADRTARERPAH